MPSIFAKFNSKNLPNPQINWHKIQKNELYAINLMKTFNLIKNIKVIRHLP